jgi:hypothetical protein
MSRRHDNAHPSDADDLLEPIAPSDDRTKRSGEFDFLLERRCTAVAAKSGPTLPHAFSQETLVS